jgi:hypothetical protein
MPRDWSEERWIKVYLVDSASWVSLTWHARGLYLLLQRAADRTGTIDLGPVGVRGLGALLRASWDELAPSYAELVESGYVVELDGALSLPEHIAQQEARASDAARQRESRRKKRSHDVSRDVTRSHAESRAVTKSHDKRREDKRREEESRATRARAREAAAASADPKAQRIASELASHRKFEGLDHGAVAEELLGALGSLALGLTDERIPEAIALAAAEAESGANERRLRQVLGWKLKDAANGRTKVPRVQGDDATFEQGMAKIYADIAAFEAQPKRKSEIDL